MSIIIPTDAAEFTLTWGEAFLWLFAAFCAGGCAALALHGERLR